MNPPPEPALTLQEQLNELYLRDSHLRGLRSRMDAAGRRLEAQQRKLEQLQRQQAELRDESRRLQARTAAAEQDAAAADAKVERFREQMNTVKNNKEYSALLVEVNTLKDAKRKVEDQVLEFMQQAEAYQQRLAEADAKVAEQEKMVDVARKAVDESRSEVGDKLDEVTKQRQDAAAALPAPALVLFDRVAAQTDGEAMADIEVQDYKRMEYTCGGCYMALPIERVNAAITRPDAPTQCPYCQRILRVSDAIKQKLAPVEK